MEELNVESLREIDEQEKPVASEEKVDESPIRWANINWDERMASLDQQYATCFGRWIV